MRLFPRRLRRLLLPVELAALVTLAAIFGALALVGFVAIPLDKARRLLRVAGFGLAYTLIEVGVLAAAGVVWLRHPRLGKPSGRDEVWVEANRRLLAWALGSVLGAARACFGFEVEVEGPEHAAFGDPNPLLVLARHGGPGDSFALVYLLLTRYQRRVRIVVKEILAIDPALDVLLNRLGCCFLPSGPPRGEALASRLAVAARDLSRGDALLVFPEGGNWTPKRRRRAIHRLRSERGAAAARPAVLMTNVLPPRPAGVLACLDARPDLGVVVVAHAGLDRLTSARQMWSGIPLSTKMRVRAWPAAAPPTGDEERKAWLTTEWATVDAWVDACHSNPR
ncbi:MAG: 1-acyl-sn-glycerol-3-phosphate acyltransferase [Acidimicrobiales bacterium]